VVAEVFVKEEPIQLRLKVAYLINSLVNIKFFIDVVKYFTRTNSVTSS